MEFLNSPLGKLAISLLLLGAIAPVVVRFFRARGRARSRGAGHAHPRGKGGRLDARVPVTFALGALSLLLINYYGSHDFYDRDHPAPTCRLRQRPSREVSTWAPTRISTGASTGACRATGLPCCRFVWPFVFKESPLDLGLRFRGFREHAWIYLLCLVIVIPTLVVVSHTP
jgi:hypothetical protein